jgi:hypothetical protein
MGLPEASVVGHLAAIPILLLLVQSWECRPALSFSTLSLPSLSSRPLWAPLLVPPTDAATSLAACEAVRMPPPVSRRRWRWSIDMKAAARWPPSAACHHRDLSEHRCSCGSSLRRCWAGARTAPHLFPHRILSSPPTVSTNLTPPLHNSTIGWLSARLWPCGVDARVLCDGMPSMVNASLFSFDFLCIFAGSGSIVQHSHFFNFNFKQIPGRPRNSLDNTFTFYTCQMPTEVQF